MPKFIILNGPPGSGKDTIAGELYYKLISYVDTYAVRMKFASTMKAALAAWLGLAEEDALLYFEDSFLKDTPSDLFLGMTPRQALISFSEDWVKPKFGKDAFGKLMVKRCKGISEDVVIISDCGFAEELKPLVEEFGEANIALVRLEREDTSFVGDSRGYIFSHSVLSYGKKFGFEGAFHNAYDPIKVATHIADVLDSFLHPEADVDDDIPF